MMTMGISQQTVDAQIMVFAFLTGDEMGFLQLYGQVNSLVRKSKGGNKKKQDKMNKKE